MKGHVSHAGGAERECRFGCNGEVFWCCCRTAEVKMVQGAGGELFSEDEQSCVGVYLQGGRRLYEVSSGLYLYHETASFLHGSQKLHTVYSSVPVSGAGDPESSAASLQGFCFFLAADVSKIKTTLSLQVIILINCIYIPLSKEIIRYPPSSF